MAMKSPLTQAGIERATFRSVAQHLNHCATAGPAPIRLKKFKYTFFVTVIKERRLEWLACDVRMDGVMTVQQLLEMETRRGWREKS